MSLQMHQDIIRALEHCASVCDYCAAACLEEDQVAKLTACIRLDIQCAAVCRLQALLLVHDSQYSRDITRTCIRLCRSCAEECSQHEHEHCQQCAQACHTCAQACEALVN